MGQEWQTAQSAGLWSWSPHQWSWSPHHARWKLGLGLPKSPIFFDVSTDALPQASRYELWRSLLYYSFDGDPLSPTERASFSARTQCLIGDPAQLLQYRSSAVSGRGLPASVADDRETYVIGVVLDGKRHYEQEGASPVVSRPGEFFVFDNRWHSRVAWSDHRAIQFSVARADLEKRLGGTIPEPSVFMRLLEASHMGKALKAQMHLSAAHMVGANEFERAFMLDQLMHLAFFTCESATEAFVERSKGRSELYLSAIQLIEQNLGGPGFDAKALQAQLGCSRATLYRAFAEVGTSVTDTITELRIARAKAMLTRSPEMPVSLVAARSGWYDSATFARSFRRREGMSPSEFRQQTSSRQL
jgi:AraC-like DNA-binding protein